MEQKYHRIAAQFQAMAKGFHHVQKYEELLKQSFPPWKQRWWLFLIIGIILGLLLMIGILSLGFTALLDQAFT